MSQPPLPDSASPQPSLQTQCPHCGQPYTVTQDQLASMAGRTFPCTRCGKTFSLMPGGAAPSGGAAGSAPFAPATYAAGGGPETIQYDSRPGQASNPMALVSLICGVLLCIPLLPSLVAIITGALGIKKAKDPNVSGKGMAIAGLTLGIVGLVGWAGYALLMASILVPSLGRARETANRVKCASNMRQIGLAILLYSNENRGSYPPRLEDLLLTQDITSAEFTCPSTSDTSAPGTSPQTVAQNLSAGGHLSFVYVGSAFTNTTATPDAIVLHEPMTNHGSDGMNVLFGDGHVEFLTKVEAQRVLNELSAGHNPPRKPGGGMGQIVEDLDD